MRPCKSLPGPFENEFIQIGSCARCLRSPGDGYSGFKAADALVSETRQL